MTTSQHVYYYNLKRNLKKKKKRVPRILVSNATPHKRTVKPYKKKILYEEVESVGRVRSDDHFTAKAKGQPLNQKGLGRKDKLLLYDSSKSIEIEIEEVEPDRHEGVLR